MVDMRYLIVCGFLVLLSKTQAQTADQWFESGFEKYEAKDYVGAIADYTECINLAPDYPEAYFNLSLIHI